MVEILEKYKDYLLARKRSLSYYNIMKVFLEYLQTKNIDMRNMTQETITEFFNLHSEYSSSTRNQYIKSGRSFYDFLNIEPNEWKNIKLLRIERKIPNYITEDEITNAKKYLLDIYTKKMRPEKIRAIVDFLYYSGCRKTELLTIKRNHFNLKENIAKVYGKGNKERIVCYPEKVKKEINTYFQTEEEKINAFNITIAKIHYMMKLMEQYLGKKIYTHLLRHSFARNLIYNKGVDLNTVSKLLGHNSLNTTMIYVNPDEKTIKENYKKLVG